MTSSFNKAWQQAVRESDLKTMASLLDCDSNLVHEQIVHTRGNGTTYGVLPLEMLNQSVAGSTLLLDHGADPNRHGDGESLAIHNASHAVTMLLLDAGAEVNRIGYEQCTPVMYETYMRNRENVRLLIERGADVNYQRKLDGLTSLHVAVKNGDSALIGVLVGASADPHLIDSGGKTPIDFARDEGREELLEMLEGHG